MKHSPLPWKACKTHEDWDGPYFDIDPEDADGYAERPLVRICSSEGIVTTNHDLFEFKPGDAEFIVHCCNNYVWLADLIRKSHAALFAADDHCNITPGILEELEAAMRIEETP